MSVLLDANGVSGLTRKTLDPAVEPGAARYALEDQFSSPTGEAELAYGAAILPARRHRTTLISHIEAMLHNVVEDQVLPFDGNAARVYPGISGTNRAASCPLSPANYQIAAAARCRSMEMATCIVRIFDDIEIETVSPSAVA